jgi:transposase
MNYSLLISEDVEFLQIQERLASKALVRDRIRFLRLLKTGQANTQSAAGLLIGIATRQSQRLWQTYREEGFSALLSTHYQHSFGKLSAHQLSLLLTFLRSDQASKLEDVQAFIASSFEVHYTLSGLSKLFTRLKIKYKTGRPSNVRKEAAQEEAFKKTLLT